MDLWDDEIIAYSKYLLKEVIVCPILTVYMM